MNIIFAVGLILIFATIFSLLARKIKVPTVVALLLLGLLINISKIRTLIEPNLDFLFGIGNFALLCLMFLAGLESSWSELYKEKKDAIFIAVFASLTPFLLGFIASLILGFPTITSFIVGICMSITAEATKAKVLLRLKKLKTKVGATMMGAGIIDDVIGLGLFVFAAYFINKGYYIFDLFLVLAAIFSFFLGIFAQRIIGRHHTFLKTLEFLLVWFIVPFFFVMIGLHISFKSIGLNPGILLTILIIAIAGKLIGTFLTKPLTKFKWNQLFLIGWAMNSRGAIEMALALIAFESNLLSAELFSSLILMALISTLIFPFIITKMIKDDPKIMN